MNHGPAVELEKDNSAERKSKLGLILFFVYSLIYIGFVAINIANPKFMETKIIFNLNLAVVYGFGLIIVAIVMGLIYNHVCTKWENEMNPKDEKHLAMRGENDL